MSKRSKVSKKSKIIIASAVIFVIVGCAFFIFKPEETEIEYSVYTVKTADPLQLKGKVEPAQKQLYYFDATKGTVKNIPVKNGQEVSKGAALIDYENHTIQNELTVQQHSINKSSLDASQAESSVASGEVQVQTITNQINDTQQKISQSKSEEEKNALNEQLKQQQAELQSATNQLNQARFEVQRAYEDVQSATDVLDGQKQQVETTIKSEMDGIVSINEQGKTSQEVPMVTIASKVKQIKGVVTEYDLDRLVEGQDVEVTTVGDNKKAKGKIKTIASSAISDSNDSNNMASYEFIVEGDFTWSDDLSTIISIKQNQLILPESAITKKENKEYVFKYVSGKVKQTEIETQDINGRKVIKSGVKANEKIIENPDSEIKDGSEVQVRVND